jgi:hypothetical protein
MTIKQKYVDLILTGNYPKRTTPPKTSTGIARTIMKSVVPDLTSEDFLGKWQEDRKELEKVQAENTKLKKIMNTTWSKDWSKKINENEKK